MSAFLVSLLAFLLLYKYWALFLVVFSAAVMVPLPVSTLLIATGAFISQGYFSFPVSLAIAMIANMAGDSFGYFLAHRYGRRALRIMRVSEAKYLDRLEHHAKNYPGLSVFLTRFVGTLDPLMNLLSGFTRIPFGKFLFYDFLGNLIAIGGIIYVGYFLGIYWQDFLNLFNIGGWIFGGVIVFIIAMVMWYENHKRRVKNRQ